MRLRPNGEASDTVKYMEFGVDPEKGTFFVGEGTTPHEAQSDILVQLTNHLGSEGGYQISNRGTSPTQTHKAE